MADNLKRTLKDGKTQNITIRVSEELRTKVEELWRRDYYEIPFNSFLGYLVSKGAKEEEFVTKYRQRRDEIKVKYAENPLNELIPSIELTESETQTVELNPMIRKAAEKVLKNQGKKATGL